MDLPPSVAAQLGLPDVDYDLYLALLAIVRGALLGGEGVSLTRVGDKLEISLSGSLVGGSGVKLIRDGNVVTISLIDDLIEPGVGITVLQNEGRYEINFNGIEESATIAVSGTDPYRLDLAPGALQGAGAVSVVRDPVTGVFTISSEGLQWWTEQYNATQGVTSWDAVNASVGALRNLNGFTLNKGLLSSGAAITLGLDSVDLHQSNGPTATGTKSGILAGSNNTAGGTTSAVLAGESNTAGGTNATVGGGDSNGAFGVNSGVLGGQNNQATGLSATVLGGVGNRATGTYNVIGGGAENSTSAESSCVLAGRLNVADGMNSSVITGRNNRVHGLGAAVLCGDTNIISVEVAYYSAIVAGQVNIIYENNSAILCGAGNTVNAIQSSVLSGELILIDTPNTHNFATGKKKTCGSSAGGKNVTVKGSHSLAMGYELVTDAHSSFTSGSYLHNGKSNSTLLGKHGVSSPSAAASLDFCSGTLDDPRALVTLTERDGVGMALLDSVSLSGDNVAYLFPKSPSHFSSGEEGDVGYFVTLDGDGRVRPTSDASDAIGVTVTRSGLILNSFDHHWQGKYMRSDLGTLLTRPSYIDSLIDSLQTLEYDDMKTGKTLRDEILTAAIQHDDETLLSWVKSTYMDRWPQLDKLDGPLEARNVPLLSGSYDATLPYRPRLERKDEWVPVCHKGLVRVRADQACAVGRPCSVKDGIATAAKSGWTVVNRVSPSVVTILL